VRDRLGEASVVPLGTLVHRRRLAHVPFGTLSSRALAPANPSGSPVKGESGLRVPRSPRPCAGARPRDRDESPP
jgi:hypothetical protein